MKKILSTVIALIMMAVLFCAPAFSVSAEEEEGFEINMLEDIANWKTTSMATSAEKGRVEINDNEMDIFSVARSGSLYTKHKFADATYSFDFEAEWLYADVPVKQAFVTFMFLQDYFPNNVTGEVMIPWLSMGGFPYALAFDFENNLLELEESNRRGLSLRKYKYDGGHDFDYWSTVNPVEAEYTATNGMKAKSMVPESSSPVTVDDILDGERHSVVLDVRLLSVENGDAQDAVEIKVNFDGELVLHVIDAMPYETTDDLGDDISVDKRSAEGYSGFFYFDEQANDFGSPNFSFKIYDLKAVKYESNLVDGGSGNQGGETGGGCGSAVAVFNGVLLPVSLVTLATIPVLCIRRKRR